MKKTLKEFRVSNLEFYIIFEPRDIWVGVFVSAWGDYFRDLYICVLPMLPVQIIWCVAARVADEGERL